MTNFNNDYYSIFSYFCGLSDTDYTNNIVACRLCLMVHPPETGMCYLFENLTQAELVFGINNSKQLEKTGPF